MTQKLQKFKTKYVSNTGFSPKLAQANAITKRNSDEKIIEIENKIKKLQTFDSGYLEVKIIFMKMVHKIV